MHRRYVGKTPDSSLAWNNKVYCNSNDELLRGRSRIVQIGERYFQLEPHRKMGRDSFGFNAIQRNSIGASAGEDIRVKAFTPDVTMQAYSMKIELIRLDKKRSDVKISQEKLNKVLSKVFKGQVFGQGQEFAADFLGTPLKCKIAEMSAADPDAAEDEMVIKLAFCAQLTADTIMNFVAPNRDITIESAQKSNTMFLDPNWKFADMGIGGLDNEFSTIFRRAFSSRLLPKQIVNKLGVQHTRGMLLYGPPGCGKTLIAREIGKMLRAREPKIVNGPEILNPYVGKSEENIRNLFKDAEAELKSKGDDSALHIIILDELDAICKKRGSSKSGTGVHDTIVNQFLSKMDGVNSLNNILIIGMTNRKDMIDEALLRPGRLEVHVEIGLPDEKGRLQILNIHTKKLRLSRALHKDVDLVKLAELAKNFSGAEIRGLVSNATTFATNRCVQYSKEGVKMDDPEKILICMKDFMNALEECKKQQTFGVEEEDLKNDMLGGLIPYGAEFKTIQKTLNDLTRQVKESKATRLLSVLLHGPKGSGKTALAANLALESDFPFVKMISPVRFVGMHETQRAAEIGSIFDAAYKTPLSVIILDQLERLLDYVPVGPRFSNTILQTIMVLTNRVPPKGSSVLVIATCSSARVLRDLSLEDAFNVKVKIPHLTKPEHVKNVLTEMKLELSSGEADKIANSCALPIGIKQLLMVIEMTRVACEGLFTCNEFMRRLEDTGLSASKKSFLDDDYMEDHL